MKYTLLALPLLAAAFRAQEEDVYRSLNVGDRVTITFRNGNTLTGTLIVIPVDGKGKRDGAKAEGAAPFILTYFQQTDDPLCKEQDIVLSEWLKKHREAKVDVVTPSDRADLWKKFQVRGTPTLVIEDKTGATAVVLRGVQTEVKLEQGLGQVRTGSGDGQSVDYTREPALTLDVSWEYPGLNGSITVGKDQIKALQKLQKLDPQTLKNLTDQRKKIAEDLEKANNERRADQKAREEAAAKAAERLAKEESATKTVSGEGETIRKNAEELVKALAIYGKFPEPAWGEARHQQILNKMRTRLVIPLDEQEFMQNYTLWQKGKAYQDLKKGGEKKPEAPVPAPAPEAPESNKEP